MKLLHIKEYSTVDLDNPKQALNYLIYLTEDSRRLIDLSLAFGLEKISLSEFFKNYYSCKFIKRGYLIQYPYEFYNTFISKNDSFTFDPYFFDNDSSSDIEKIAKINRLICNINNLLNEIRKETETNDLEYPEVKNDKDFNLSFQKKFPNYMITYNYQSEKPFKERQYPYKLLLFYFGVKLNEILKKIITNYVGFIKEPTIEKYLPSSKTNKKTSKNPFPEIFKSNDTYRSFLNYSNKHIIEPYKDYSYLFQRLKKEGLIHDMKHKKFIDWLLSEDLIKEKGYNHFIDNGGFRSYSKSYRVDRENNFNNIFNE